MITNEERVIETFVTTKHCYHQSLPNVQTILVFAHFKNTSQLCVSLWISVQVSAII